MKRIAIRLKKKIISGFQWITIMIFDGIPLKGDSWVLGGPTPIKGRSDR